MSEIPAEAQDWLERGRTDIHLWALRGLGIDLHPAQIELAEALMKGVWMFFILTWANRAGKTTALLVVCLHRLFYKLGMPPAKNRADYAKRWLPKGYRILWVAPLNRLTGRAFNLLTEILKGTSEAQIIREDTHCGVRPGEVVGEHRAAPLAPLFQNTRERIETGADKLFLRCATGGVMEFESTEGGGGRLEGEPFWFIVWDEWPQQEAADKAEAIRTVLTRLENRASDYAAPIVITGTITPETEHIAKEWLSRAEDPDNPDWWGNYAARSLNPSANRDSIARAERNMDKEDFDRTVLGVPGGVRGRVFPSVLLDPAFDPKMPAFRPKEDGYTYLHLWDIALTTAENVGIVLRIPEDWLFGWVTKPDGTKEFRPILGARLKVVPGSRTLTSAEIVHTIEETYLPYGGLLYIDTTDAHGKGIQRELRNAGYPAKEYDFHGRTAARGTIRKEEAIKNARKLLFEGAEPRHDGTGKVIVDGDGVVQFDLTGEYGVFRLPAAWRKVSDQLAVLREDDKGQKKDAAMAFLMGADEAFRHRRKHVRSPQGGRFAVFAGADA